MQQLLYKKMCVVAQNNVEMLLEESADFVACMQYLLVLGAVLSCIYKCCLYTRVELL